MSKKINTPADFEKPTDEELRRGSVHLNGFVDIESPQDFAKAFESKKLTVEDVNQLFEGVPLRNKPAPQAGNDLGQVLGAHDVERGTEINPRYVGRGTKQMHIPEYSLEDLANVEIYREKLKADRKAVEEIKNEADSESNPFAEALDKWRKEIHKPMKMSFRYPVGVLPMSHSSVAMINVEQSDKGAPWDNQKPDDE